MGYVDDGGSTNMQSNDSKPPGWLNAIFLGGLFFCGGTLFGRYTADTGGTTADSASPGNNTWLEATCPEHVIPKETAIERGRELARQLKCCINLRYRDRKILIPPSGPTFETAAK